MTVIKSVRSQLREYCSSYVVLIALAMALVTASCCTHERVDNQKLTAALAAANMAQDSSLTRSPDGKLIVATAVGADGSITYAFLADDKPLIVSSKMGLDFGQAGKMPASAWRVSRTITNSVNEVWKPVWGKRVVVPDRYNETVIDMQGPIAPFDLFRLVVRAYDDGIAFRYEIPLEAKGLKSQTFRDLTTYNFADDFTAWFYNGENHNLGPNKLSAVSGTRKPVMTVKAGEDAYMAIHEADLRSGKPLELTKNGRTGFAAVAAAGKVDPGYVSTWRVVLFGRQPGTMVDSHLIELLNPPPVGDFSWVKPGLAVWDWRINGAEANGFKYMMSYPSWTRMVDFAAENGIRYLVLDADWYGPEFAHSSDPVKGDKAADVQQLIAYGKTKGIGIWLYLNDVGGKRFPIEQTLKQYGIWGAAGVKYGFMNGSPEEKNVWTRIITELCARNHLLCDYHDGPVHPYGQMRTWPNAVTREFCHAQLDARRVFVPKTFVTTVFVNMLSGPLDMNNGMFDLRQGPTTRTDNKMEVPSTLVSEAARTLIVFSGVTIIPDIPDFYRKYPELLAFLAAQKMPWQESKTLSGVIGEHIVMARQAADGTWLVGAATDETGRELDIPLNFLEKGNYEGTIIQDGDDAHYLRNRETFKVEKRTVKPSDSIHVKLAPGGGACLIIKKVTEGIQI